MEVYIRLCVTAVYSKMIYEAFGQEETDSSDNFNGFPRDAEWSGYCCSTIITRKFISRDYLQKPEISTAHRRFTSIVTHEKL